jgi:16S rRNA G966 N2-methylase RsmD
MTDSEPRINFDPTTQETHLPAHTHRYETYQARTGVRMAARDFQFGNNTNSIVESGAVVLGDRFCFYDPTKIQPPAETEIMYSVAFPMKGRSETIGSGFLIHSLGTLAALGAMEEQIKGAVVVDLGSGSGFQSLAALKMGASRVIMYERNEEALYSAKELLKQNGIAEDRVVFIHDDLENLSAHQEELSKVNFAIANIGGWGQEYGEAHLLAARITGMIPDLEYYIAGGYYYDSLWQDPWIYHLQEVAAGERKIKELLSRNGLEVFDQIDVKTELLLNSSRAFIFKRN